VSPRVGLDAVVKRKIPNMKSFSNTFLDKSVKLGSFLAGYISVNVIV
jgi:hypothetical protein